MRSRRRRPQNGAREKRRPRRAHLKNEARRTVSQNGTMTLRPTMLKNAVVRLEKRAIAPPARGRCASAS